MKASPAAMPSEPPMKAKSCTSTTAGWPLDLAVADGHGVLLAGGLARRLQALGIGLAVGELQRVVGDDRATAMRSNLPSSKV